MPSFRAYLTSWVIWAKFYQRKRASEQQILLSVCDTWKGKFDEEVIPASIQTAIKVTEESFRGTGDAAQEWKVFHCSADDETGHAEGGSKGKIVIYWHGGAFVNAAAPQHWSAVRKVVQDHHLPVVFPQYTRAPLGTASGWCLNAIQFTLGIANDPRYKSKTIVHMGDSAGGWMSLRIRQLMCGIVLGEEEGYEGVKEEVESLIKRTGASVLISPLVNIEITEKLLETDALDPWLSIPLLKGVRRLWCRGPASVPEIDFGLPAGHSAIPTSPEEEVSEELYADPRYSLNNGLDVFSRYHAKHPEAAPLHILTMIGTYDLCHVGCADMQERLEKLGQGVVRADYIEEKGLNHVYAILEMPEADKAWQKIGEVLRE